MEVDWESLEGSSDRLGAIMNSMGHVMGAITTLACDPLAVGRIVQADDHLELGMHSSVAAKAMKALSKEGVAGAARTAELVL